VCVLVSVLEDSSLRPISSCTADFIMHRYIHVYKYIDIDSYICIYIYIYAYKSSYALFGGFMCAKACVLLLSESFFILRSNRILFTCVSACVL